MEIHDVLQTDFISSVSVIDAWDCFKLSPTVKCVTRSWERANKRNTIRMTNAATIPGEIALFPFNDESIHGPALGYQQNKPIKFKITSNSPHLPTSSKPPFFPSDGYFRYALVFPHQATKGFSLPYKIIVVRPSWLGESPLTAAPPFSQPA